MKVPASVRSSTEDLPEFEFPNDARVQGALHNYRLLMLRNPVSLKFSLSFANIFLGVALMFSAGTPVSAALIVKWVSLKAWGVVLVLTAILRIASIGIPSIPRVLSIASAFISIFMWIYLCVSAFQSAPPDVLHWLFISILPMELWSLVHTLVPHTTVTIRKTDA